MARPLILVTNDDGIVAPGIRTLIEVMKELGDVVNHFVKLGYPEEMITNFILNWMDKNNVNIKEKIRPKRAK